MKKMMIGAMAKIGKNVIKNVKSLHMIIQILCLTLITQLTLIP